MLALVFQVNAVGIILSARRGLLFIMDVTLSNRPEISDLMGSPQHQY